MRNTHILHGRDLDTTPHEVPTPPKTMTLIFQALRRGLPRLSLPARTEIPLRAQAARTGHLARRALATEPPSTPDNSDSSTLPDARSPDGVTDWSRSYHGLSEKAFPPEITDVLLAPIDPMDIEIKPGKPGI